MCRFDALLSLCRKRCGIETIGIVLLVEVHENVNRGLKRKRTLGLIPGLPVVTLLYWGVRKAAYLNFMLDVIKQNSSVTLATKYKHHTHTSVYSLP